MVGFTFNITVSKGEAVHYSSNNPSFERNILEQTLYGADDNDTRYTITYRIDPRFGTNSISETRTCTNLRELQIILNEVQATVQQAQQ